MTKNIEDTPERQLADLIRQRDTLEKCLLQFDSEYFRLQESLLQLHDDFSSFQIAALKELLQAFGMQGWKTESYLPSFRLALVADDFTADALSHECSVLSLSSKRWKEQIEDFSPQLVLVESAWYGAGKSWHKKINGCAPDLVELSLYCKAQGIKTAFWNKEDPAHYDTFLASAALFDVVFTTDSEKIPFYKAELGHDQVHLLPFACQPMLHNPILSEERMEAVSFAGSYYPQYPERCENFETLYDTLIKIIPWYIYDRNYDTTSSDFVFPERFKTSVVGSLKYSEIDKAYKGYKFGLNLNTVKNSPTMFARRVVELLASGTLVLSNDSIALKRLFGNLILASDSPEAHGAFVQKTSAEHQRLIQLSLRKVLSQHHWQQRIAYVIKKTLNLSFNDQAVLLVVAKVDTAHERMWLEECFLRQSCSNAFFLIVDSTQTEGTRCKQPRIASFSVAVAQSLKLANYFSTNVWLAHWHPADYYGANYLFDLQMCIPFVPSGVITHSRHYYYDSELRLSDDNAPYSITDVFNPHSSLIQSQLIPPGISLLELTAETVRIEPESVLGVTEYEYCKNARLSELSIDQWSEKVCLSNTEVDAGLSITEVLEQANMQAAAIKKSGTGEYTITSEGLASLFSLNNIKKDCELDLIAEGLVISSSLGSGKHDYWFSVRNLELSELNLDHKNSFLIRLVAEGALDLWGVFLFKDSEGKDLGFSMHGANHYRTVTLPAGSHTVQLALRWVGSGRAVVKALNLSRADYFVSSEAGSAF
ncbi:glycosyltransferase [Rheinheimera soli]|uniref:Spore maturation protein CgeB n=1 Tax=Rheinheimera soli TaxID=443616 RepID=A0ABU1VUR3_9GAMM|nr:glycosyltransferase [Rheinheimera soli]MDR7119310.1 spore maturation protein CgeB [Rheinheimera soli]